jgi:PAS domain S-box-containing protein
LDTHQSAPLPSAAAGATFAVDDTMLELLPAAVYLCDASGTIVRFNRKAAALWGQVPHAGDAEEKLYRLFRPNGQTLPPAGTPMAEVLRTGISARDVEMIMEKPDGERLWVLANIDPVKNAAGEIVGAINCIQDITARKDAEKTMRESQELLRAIVETTPECVKIVARDGRLLHMNSVGLGIVEAEDEKSVVGRRVLDLVAPEHHEIWRAHHERVCKGERLTWEFDIIALRGTRRHMETHAAPLKMPDGTTAHLGVTRDITDKRRQADALRGSDARFRQLLDALPAAVYTTDAAGRLTFYNEAAVAFAGRRPQLGSDQWCVSWRLYRSDGTRMPHDECPMAVALKTGQPIRDVEAVAERPDGTRVDFVPYPTPLRDESGAIVGAVNMLVDITERKKAEKILQELNNTLEQRVEDRTRQMSGALDQLRDSEHRFRSLVDGVTDYAIFMLDTEGIVVNWNSGAERIKGYKAHEIVGQHFSRFYTHEDRANGLPGRALSLAMREGRYEAEGWRVRKNGEHFWANVVIDAIYDDDRKIVGFAKVTRDISERKKAEHAIRESERLARGIIDTALDAFVQMDGAGIIREWNAQAEKIFGWTREEAAGQSFGELIVSPSQRSSHKRALERYLRAGGESIAGRRLELEALRRDGGPITVEMAITAFRRDDGVVFNGFIRDLTDKIAAEAQLRQAQKMEAIGQLTGGIAHDFNNLLAAILPSLELAKSRTQDERVLKYLDNAARAADRGADLTRQLLSFSRKQDLVVKQVDANRLISEICEMLPRTLGPTTSIETNLAESAWVAMTDATQLELAILNLAINARDAMPQGGLLRIATENVAAHDAGEVWRLDPGDYLMISVTDNGTGMSETVRSRVFEPFFTTKEAGKGSGLGLSMVYGFAKQSGGNVVLESRVGRGTTIRLFLPRALALRASRADIAVGQPSLDAGPPSRLLVIDDDDAVREVTVTVVQGFGHTAVDVGSGQAALTLLERDRRFDLMIVDLAMPHMDGTTFAEKARIMMPEVPVLFVTGFAERHFLKQAANDLLLRKPFRRAQLAEKLRDMLAHQAS